MARDIVAIDVHVHLSDEITQKAKGDRTAQMARYFGRERPPVSIDEMADQYRARKMMAVIMNTRDETVTGLTPVPNDHVAERDKKTSRRISRLRCHRSVDRQIGDRRNQTLQRFGTVAAWASSIRRANTFSPTIRVSIRSGNNAPNSICRSCSTAAWRRPAPALPAAWASN